MKRIALAFVMFLCLDSYQAQISHGGQPYNWENKSLSSDIPFMRTDEVDLVALAAEDAIVDQHKDQPYRFGVEHETSFDLNNSGRILIDPATGREIWQLGIHCPEALSISIRFDEFRIPKGGEVFIWSADRKEFLGSFDHRNNKPSGILALGLIHGDKIIIEYSYPSDADNRGALRVGQVVHSYRPFATSPFVQEALEQIRGPFGDSGNCEVNVNCPEGADWQIEKRAVALIVEGGSGLCTGSLVNNTANDGTPYFLTANHCIQGSNTNNWVFYFNHEAANCNGSNGPTTDLISGAEVVANNGDSDFALLLLDETPPPSYNVQYAGWDATDSENEVESACCIHHPAGDVKKISFEDDAPYHNTSAGADVWFVDNWELAVTEGGSSGSPLFNQDHRIIGQLYGGLSGCIGSQGNGFYDYFGRFGVSWDNSASASSRLRDWLDPGNTGVLVLDGYPDGFTAQQYDAEAGEIGNVALNNCTSVLYPSFTLVNNGTETMTTCVINFQLNNGTVQNINWSGNLTENESEELSLGVINATDGNNSLTVWVTNPNGNADQNNNNDQAVLNFTAFTGTAYNVTITINFDNYPEETSWQITNDNNVVLFSGGTYQNETDGSTINVDVCLPVGCYDFTIFDSEDDGLCCNYGQGEYQVTDQMNQVLASGDSFGASESTNICIVTSVEENASNKFTIYPNPSNEVVRITSSGIMNEIRISDVTGRLTKLINTNSKVASIDTSAYPDGVYWVSVITAEGMSSSKLIIRH